MNDMELKIIYEDGDVLVVDKPAGIVVFPEGKTDKETLIDYLLEKHPYLKEAGAGPRYGIVHRLDKDTSGILLVAKNNESLIFFQKQFFSGKEAGTLEKILEKRYIALVVGNIEDNDRTIETLIGRAPGRSIKQKAYLPLSPDAERKRLAITNYKKLEEFKEYTLLEVEIRTGRKHQIRCHMAYIQHPIAGDKLYGFKNQTCPKGLTRQFLHAARLKIQMPNGQIKEFESNLPEDLEKTLKELIKK
jgi:23S rRNA pseudouridine1911/1915/1917 synthase